MLWIGPVSPCRDHFLHLESFPIFTKRLLQRTWTSSIQLESWLRSLKAMRKVVWLFDIQITFLAESKAFDSATLTSKKLTLRLVLDRLTKNVTLPILFNASRWSSEMNLFSIGDGWGAIFKLLVFNNIFNLNVPSLLITIICFAYVSFILLCFILALHFFNSRLIYFDPLHLSRSPHLRCLYHAAWMLQLLRWQLASWFLHGCKPWIFSSKYIRILIRGPGNRMMKHLRRWAS